MYISFKRYFLICFIVVFTGCSYQQIDKKTIVSPKVVDKKPKYKFCHNHIEIMRHASTYIFNEFEKGYFAQEDDIGAKAQVFLIENRSPTPFSENINAALDSYKKQYNLAKKYKCDLNDFGINPLDKIKDRIKTIEAKKEKDNK